jgi:hypothetical protein
MNKARWYHYTYGKHIFAETPQRQSPMKDRTTVRFGVWSATKRSRREKEQPVCGNGRVIRLAPGAPA